MLRIRVTPTTHQYLMTQMNTGIILESVSRNYVISENALKNSL